MGLHADTIPTTFYSCTTASSGFPTSRHGHTSSAPSSFSGSSASHSFSSSSAYRSRNYGIPKSPADASTKSGHGSPTPSQQSPPTSLSYSSQSPKSGSSNSASPRK
ncbi:unnamed protein product [Aspergillus oryzae var. brunneus]|uniref:Unnamed protein product n=2 Tax=Aspergillus oryzae TaxID=5062 RepID=A0AAN5C430_ASPOZ|nr:unnamed protein product [Aspergillus oryzae]GMG37051.1 unnamed protein product [Aspergillus oryzae]GMG46818.1 unnamed protein product [Aspergillus oryzae var. brunneus]